MIDTKIYAFLTETFREVFGREVIPTPNMSASDVAGWDSFAQISIVMATEEHFKIEFTTAELNELRNVGSFVDTISRKLSEGKR